MVKERFFINLEGGWWRKLFVQEASIHGSWRAWTPHGKSELLFHLVAGFHQKEALRFKNGWRAPHFPIEWCEEEVHEMSPPPHFQDNAITSFLFLFIFFIHCFFLSKIPFLSYIYSCSQGYFLLNVLTLHV